ncbi:Gallinacin-2, partial [Dryobates pubescens]
LCVVVIVGSSSPRRDLLFCRNGSCHFGKCPVPLIKVGRCFGFRNCCK